MNPPNWADLLLSRLLDAANNVGEASGDLIHWDVDQQEWTLPLGPGPFLAAVVTEYDRLGQSDG